MDELKQEILTKLDGFFGGVPEKDVVRMVDMFAEFFSLVRSIAPEAELYSVVMDREYKGSVGFVVVKGNGFFCGVYGIVLGNGKKCWTTGFEFAYDLNDHKCRSIFTRYDGKRSVGYYRSILTKLIHNSRRVKDALRDMQYDEFELNSMSSNDIDNMVGFFRKEGETPDDAIRTTAKFLSVKLASIDKPTFISPYLVERFSRNNHLLGMNENIIMVVKKPIFLHEIKFQFEPVLAGSVKLMGKLPMNIHFNPTILGVVEWKDGDNGFTAFTDRPTAFRDLMKKYSGK